MSEDYIIREDVFMALTGDITDCTIEEFIARLRDKLSKIPSVKADGDCISREDACHLFCQITCDKDYCTEPCVNLKQYWELSSVKPKPKEGHWVEHGVKEGFLVEKYTCSECDYYSGNRTTNFCPNCGADMREQDDIPMEYFENGGI